MGSLDGLRDYVHERVGMAITRTADHAAWLARENAPVRKIFKQGGRRVRVRALSGGELAAERESRRQPLRVTSTGKKVGLATSGIKVVEERRRGIYPSNPLLRAFGQRSRVNLYHPILARGSAIEVARQLRENGSNLRSVSDIQNLLERRLKSSNLRQVGADTHTLAGGAELESALSARGRYELRSGRAVAVTVESRGKGRSPRVTVTLGGALRASIKVDPLETNGSRFHQSITAGNKQAYYAKYVEFGTRHAAGQPFLRPALAKVREEYRERMTREITSAVRTRKVGGAAQE